LHGGAGLLKTRAKANNRPFFIMAGCNLFITSLDLSESWGMEGMR